MEEHSQQEELSVRFDAGSVCRECGQSGHWRNDRQNWKVGKSPSRANASPKSNSPRESFASFTGEGTVSYPATPRERGEAFTKHGPTSSQETVAVDQDNRDIRPRFGTPSNKRRRLTSGHPVGGHDRKCEELSDSRKEKIEIKDEIKEQISPDGDPPAEHLERNEHGGKMQKRRERTKRMGIKKEKSDKVEPPHRRQKRYREVSEVECGRTRVMRAKTPPSNGEIKEASSRTERDGHLVSYIAPTCSDDVHTSIGRDRKETILAKRDESTDKLIALLGSNCERERVEKERMQSDATHLRMSRWEDAHVSNEHPLSQNLPYYMGGMTLKCNQSQRIRHTVNTFAPGANAPYLDSREDQMNSHRYKPIPAAPKHMVGGATRSRKNVFGGQTERRNSWFRPGAYHTEETRHRDAQPLSVGMDNVKE